MYIVCTTVCDMLYTVASLAVCIVFLNISFSMVGINILSLLCPFRTVSDGIVQASLQESGSKWS